MSLSFDKHEEGCRPLNPCATCRIVAFLKTKLTDGELSELDQVISSASGTRLSADTKLKDNDYWGWSVRTKNCLQNDNIQTIAELVSKTERELMRIPNFGRVSLMEVHQELKRAGWKLGDPVT